MVFMHGGLGYQATCWPPLLQVMDEATQNKLEDVLTSCKWQDVIDCILATDTAPQTSHNLVHLEVVGDHYHQKVMKPASPYVMEEMERKAGKDHIRQLQNLVHLVSDELPLGYLHEHWRL
ncbi:hypothetical protein VaNZ11_016604 [Volvox africanus]|uniref:Uncharacterized protein n=1 Tax=Volvox africanus TaxID=51714 RepID=A0ABQ5SPW2_9CHLO|nr:hypothetical protein VaNZ11_016604 [Volvox africanus]